MGGIAAATVAERAGGLVFEFVALLSYGFYLFSGCALLSAAFKLKQGDTMGFYKAACGAAVFYITPAFIENIVRIVKI